MRREIAAVLVPRHIAAAEFGQLGPDAIDGRRHNFLRAEQRGDRRQQLRMRDDVEHLGRMKPAAAQTLEIADERDAIFRGVTVDRGEPVFEIQSRVKILELAGGLELAGFLVDGLVQGLAQRLQVGRVEDVRRDEITFLVEELNLLGRERLGGFHHPKSRRIPRNWQWPAVTFAGK